MHYAHQKVICEANLDPLGSFLTPAGASSPVGSYQMVADTDAYVSYPGSGGSPGWEVQLLIRDHLGLNGSLQQSALGVCFYSRIESRMQRVSTATCSRGVSTVEFRTVEIHLDSQVQKVDARGGGGGGGGLVSL